MQIIDSLSTSLFGLSVVFAILVILILVISLQSRIAAALSNRRRRQKGQVAGAAPGPEGKPADQTREDAPVELKLVGVDEKTAAMIMAIVCDETGIAPNELIFKSIKALEE